MVYAVQNLGFTKQSLKENVFTLIVNQISALATCVDALYVKSVMTYISFIYNFTYAIAIDNIPSAIIEKSTPILSDMVAYIVKT